MTLSIRELSGVEREMAFARRYAKVDLQQYVETVREMEGGVAYAISVNGSSARALRVNLGRAAKILGLKLNWAKVSKDATELIVELA
jgi:hypothetical protein